MYMVAQLKDCADPRAPIASVAFRQPLLGDRPRDKSGTPDALKNRKMRSRPRRSPCSISYCSGFGGLGRSRRHPPASGCNIIALQRRRISVSSMIGRHLLLVPTANPEMRCCTHCIRSCSREIPRPTGFELVSERPSFLRWVHRSPGQPAFYLYATVSSCPTSEFLPFPFGAYRVHFLKWTS